MRSFANPALVILLFASPAFSQKSSKPVAVSPATERLLEANETRLWQAWKDHDPQPYMDLLPPDAIDVSALGRIQTGREFIANGVKTNYCVVKSFSLSDFQYAAVDANNIVQTYSAHTLSSCGARDLPQTITASTIWHYTRSRGTSKWLASFHQESPAPDAAKP